MKLGGPLSEHGLDASAIIKLLDENGSPGTVATAAGRYFGFVVGGALPATVAAHWLADAWDQNACLYELSPVAAQCEEIVLAWLLDLLRLPNGCGGAFVTGAQMANFTALAAARHATLLNANWNVEEDGLFARRRSRLLSARKYMSPCLRLWQCLVLVAVGSSQSRPTLKVGCERMPFLVFWDRLSCVLR